MGRGARILAMAGLVVLLAGCGAVPRPFQPAADAGPNALLARPDAVGIKVAPVVGLAPPLDGLLAAAVAAALQERDIPAFLRGGSRVSLSLRARVSAPTAPGAPLNLRWWLGDAAGRTVMAADRRWGDGAALRRADPAALAAIGADLAGAVAAALRDDVGRRVDPDPPHIVVFDVDGAPGDGNQALRAAARGALIGRGYRVDEDLGEAALVLTAQVTVAAPARQPDPAVPVETVEIVWTVLYPDGREAGRLVQRNQVPAGSLGRVWGPVAVMAAQAAMGGMETLLAGLGADDGPVMRPGAAQ